MSTQSRTADDSLSPSTTSAAPAANLSLSTRLQSYRAAFETLLIVGALLAHLGLLSHGTTSDGLRRYNELNDLLAHGQISGDKYSLIGPLFATPLWLLGHLVRTPGWWVSRFNLLLFSLALLIIYWVLKDRVDRRLIRTFLLILSIESLFPPALSSFYGETFTALGVGVGTLAVVFGPRLLGWAATAIGIANTPATLVGLGLVTLARALQSKRIWPFLAIGGAVGLIVTENLIRFHHLTNTRYEPGFTFPIYLGILSILFSFGKGLIFFTPGLFLPIRRRLYSMGSGGVQLHRVYVLWIAFTAGLVLIYAGWYDWSGDWFFGPRFFLFASLPASLALATYLRRPSVSLRVNLAVLGVLALSAWVGITATAFSLVALAGPCGVLPNGVCEYLPQSSALWFPLVSPQIAIARGLKPHLYLAFSLLVFVYLAAPLVVTIGRQTWGVVTATLSEWSWSAQITLKQPVLPRFPREESRHDAKNIADNESDVRGGLHSNRSAMGWEKPGSTSRPSS